MKLFRLFIASLFALALSACASKIDCTVPARIVDGTIVTQVPPRAPGQASMLRFAAEPIDTVRIALVGLGMRGTGTLKRLIHHDQSEARIVAVCDVLEENVNKALQIVAEAGLPAPAPYIGEEAYKELCVRPDVDLVYVVTDWIHHTPIAVYAMEQGKHVAIEVPAATTLAECWQLVDTAEKTRRHCMMLENCVYDFFEASCLKMAQEGAFGEIYYAEGAYIHNLDHGWRRYYNNWRLDFNSKFRGDNYPTHGFGPICQALNIHRGDRLRTLVSMDTRSFRGLEHAREIMGVDSFAEGDHTVTLVRTEKDKLMKVEHNVYGIRPYSRMYSLSGTKGYAQKYPLPGGLCFSQTPGSDAARGSEIVNHFEFVPAQVRDSLLAAYRPAIIKGIEERARKVGGHGGMDFIMDLRLVYCLRHGLPLDMDVYDAAEWCSLCELSRISLNNGYLPVEVPDFTRGDWNVIDGYSYAE